MKVQLYQNFHQFPLNKSKAELLQRTILLRKKMTSQKRTGLLMILMMKKRMGLLRILMMKKLMSDSRKLILNLLNKI